MMTDEERIALMKRAMSLLDEAGILLVEATRNHYAASYELAFDNLVDKNGKTITIDLGDEYKPICVELMMVGRKARKHANDIKRAFVDGSDSAKQLFEMAGRDEQTRND